MAEDLASSLDNYRVQLQQVEAALLAEPENEELQKLREDLREVIALHEDLVKSAAAADGGAESSRKAAGRADTAEASQHWRWKVGDRCMAASSKNGQYYEAVIDGISEGKAAVTFVGRKITEMNRLTQLKAAEAPQPKKNYLWEPKARTGNKQAEWAEERERRKRKALKKMQRAKQLDEEKETEKRKWKDFNHRASSKSLKGFKKGETSIFASPAANTGKVGVGTCGTSGQPMTRFNLPENKFKKTAPTPSTRHFSLF